ncbi:peptidase [Burkholderia sp. Ac-20384]|uniref:PepSY-associated TM helix domain-containing protein n=1 Tax=Burkholderia TaxID=32008 RepID=UPI0014534181|nr:PepSY-associated TM helix domain-containing protein [Burkholderia lata]MBN3828938.1 peptidase [Burkholderia sp. Ac-20384]VWC16514.1 peptidase [Burkholderia lata]
MNAPETINPPQTGTSRAGVTVLHPTARPLGDDELAARRQRSRRATFIKWLRKVHGWVGLWGAVLGLLFGVTGVLLNHRAPPLKISTGEPQVEEMQIALPDPAPKTPAAMTKWLQHELHFDGKPGRMRKEPAQPVAWGDKRVMQPEHWQMGLFGPHQNLQAEYWVGNGYVAVKRTGNTFLTTLNNLHRGVGMNLGWVLLMDTIAGSLILLSLTGVLLWTELNKRRTVGVVLVVGSVAAALAAGLT